jgi:hypothetical protein
METFHSPKGDVMVEMMNKEGKYTVHYNKGVITQALSNKFEYKPENFVLRIVHYMLGLPYKGGEGIHGPAGANNIYKNIVFGE